MNRKQRRAAAKLSKQKQTEKLSEKLFQFDKLPDQCLTCHKAFDKKDKHMATTWNVVVQDKETVRLYCPDCWKMAQDVIKTMTEEIQKNGR